MLGLRAPAMRPCALLQRPNELLVDATDQQIRHFLRSDISDIIDIICPVALQETMPDPSVTPTRSCRAASTSRRRLLPVDALDPR